MNIVLLTFVVYATCAAVVYFAVLYVWAKQNVDEDAKLIGPAVLAGVAWPLFVCVGLMVWAGMLAIRLGRKGR